MYIPENVIEAWPVILAALLLGGLAKGMMGIGLPAVAVPVLLLRLDLPTALGVMMIPSLISNLIQVVQGGQPAALVRRYWFVLLPMLPATVFGVWLLVVAPPEAAVTMLGLVTSIYVLLELTRFSLRVPQGTERVWGSVTGGMAGLVGGFTGVYSPPIVMYLLALRLEPEDFVRSISLIFLVAVLMFYPVLFAQGVLGAQFILLSAGAMIPVYLAMELGRWLRRRLSPGRARTVLLIALGLIGLNLVRRGVVGLFA